jgi:hypothetical protein
MKQISYTFKYWGPFLFCTNVSEDTIKSVKKILNKKIFHNEHLAGHIEEEFRIDEKSFSLIMKDYFNAFFEESKIFYGREICKQYTCESAWVNYMKPGEFNPPHTHDGDFSCVLYIDIPKKLIEENKKFKGRSAGPGAIRFDYGEEGKFITSTYSLFPKQNDFYMFPATLKHCVFPYTSNCTRVSVSANIKCL